MPCETRTALLSKKVYPFIGDAPLKPTEKDYVEIKPTETGRIEYIPGVVIQAYDLKPNTLYFIELTMKFEGLDEPAKLVTPFGYSKAGE